MQIDFEKLAANTELIHAALSKHVIAAETNPQLLPDLAAAADQAARRLAILANGNKVPKAEAAAA
jgi:hypothetical protein